MNNDVYCYIKDFIKHKGGYPVNEAAPYKYNNFLLSFESKSSLLYKNPLSISR
jgi:hypothetical protein